MLFVYFTDKFRKQLSGTQHEDILFKRIRDLENSSDPSALNSVDAYKKDKLIVYKLQRAYTCRVIIVIIKQTIDNEIVDLYFISEYIPKSSFGYKWGSVIHPSLYNGSWLEANPIEEEQLEKAISLYREQKQNRIRVKEPLPTKFKTWLHNFNSEINFDIYEYEKWVTYSSDNSPKGLQEKYELFFKKLIVKLLNNEIREYKLTEVNKEVFSCEDTDSQIGILFSRFREPSTKRQILIIRDGAHLKKQHQRWSQIIQAASMHESRDSDTLEKISRNSFRAYQKWILNEHENDLWQIIQRHKGNYNLSLLPEQIEFLKDFKFPVYINGQAGSGKSTMLYYLFANVFSHKIADEFDGDIIFLTENEKLLDSTRESIVGLLTSNPEFHYDLTIEQTSTIKKCFYSFSDFLIDLLPDDEKRNYPESKYLDFARYKEMFNKDYTNKFTAEEAWFVINTYVLGYDENELIDTRQKYESKVVKDFRVIPGRLFEEIVNETFPSFRRMLSQDRYWTKTKLVREIRKWFPTELPKKYTVVFCDEAQDFTKIELRLIIHSSIYMNYDLSNQDQIPIVFAGDALQTVSPNRFSITRMKQMYYQIFSESDYTFDAEKQKRTIYTPKFNYRSSESIVRLANIIQQYRRQLLQEDSNAKQTAKRTTIDSVKPILHYKEWLTEEHNYDQFLSKFKHKSFIIPTDLNDELEYVKGEYLLRGASTNKSNWSNFADIKSSINAKGAEYNQVVVYGFGDYFLDSNRGSNLPTEQVNGDNFRLTFFFNKLYVAITRAQNELIIIDSKRAAEKFWRPLLGVFMENESSWEQFKEIDEVIWINPSTGLDDVSQSTIEDALENARRDTEQGIFDNNSTRLKVAANTFQILGHENDANYSLGYSELIKGNWEKAGDLFLKAKSLELSAGAYFKGQIWSKIPRSIDGNRNRIRILIANLMVNSFWDENDFNQVYDLKHSLNLILAGVDWYDMFVSRLIGFATQNVTKIQKKRELALIIEQIVRDGDHELWELLANLYYETNQFGKAVSCWDKFVFGDEVPKLPLRYMQSQIELGRLNNDESSVLEWTGRMLFSDELNSKSRGNFAKEYVNGFSQSQRDHISDEQLSSLLAANLILGNQDEILKFCRLIEQDKEIGFMSILYRKVLNLSTNSLISAFIHERWAYVTFKQLRGDTSNKKEVLREVNRLYSEFVVSSDTNNAPWTQTELDSILTSPKTLHLEAPVHLENIIIENFKKFSKLSLTNLGQFNLVLGNNNSGKTSILEALMFTHEPDMLVRNFIFVQCQRLNVSCSKSDSYRLLEDFINYTSVDNRGLMFTISRGRRLWKYIVREPRLNERILFGITDSVDMSDYIVVEKVLAGAGPAISNSKQYVVSNIPMADVPFIPFGKGYSNDLADLYYKLIGSSRKLREAFCEDLKSFIPNIVEIVIDPDENSIKIEERIDSGDSYAQSSLHTFGEGANKLFRILIQIHASKNKRVMIDEIDAGIHYSKFKQFWKVILLTAERCNVQLFVTTHNEECIQYFHEVISKFELNRFSEKSRLITLDSRLDTGEITAIIRNYNEMNYSFDHDLEMRGNK